MGQGRAWWKGQGGPGMGPAMPGQDLPHHTRRDTEGRATVNRDATGGASCVFRTSLGSQTFCRMCCEHEQVSRFGGRGR